MNFIIDTQGEENNLSKSQFIDSDDELDFDNFSKSLFHHLKLSFKVRIYN